MSIIQFAYVRQLTAALTQFVPKERLLTYTQQFSGGFCNKQACMMNKFKERLQRALKRLSCNYDAFLHSRALSFPVLLFPWIVAAT